MNSMNLDAYEAFHHGWALLTAGVPGDVNTMTVSWGSVGSLWNKSVATVYVRPTRYTYQFMEKYDCFTVSFFEEEHRAALALLGRESGRDGDKIAKAGLTPVPFGDSVTFAQAKTTLLCKKLYSQDMDPSQIPQEVLSRFYPEGETFHRIYIGEILEIQDGKEGSV